MSKKNEATQDLEFTPEELQKLEGLSGDEYDQGVKKIKKARINKAWAQNRAEALPRVLQFLKDNKDSLGPIYNDISLFFKASMRAPAGSKPKREPGQPSINDQVRDLLIGSGSVSELDLFRQFKVGRHEMRAKVKAFILSKPEKRIWVEFDEAEETWNVRGTGAEAPEGWTGYMPPKEADKL